MHDHVKFLFSIVLLGLVDARYNFLFVDIGQAGASNDAGIYNRSKLNKMREDGLLNLPSVPHGDQLDVNFHFLGDDAFSQTQTLFKPYPHNSEEDYKAIYNYRHSRARRIVECAFGILSNRFPIIYGPILQDYDHAVKTIQACVVLHNFINHHEGLSRSDE